MASSLATRARGRAIKIAVAIRGDLKAGQAKRAVDRALGAIQSEEKSVREWRPYDAMLLDAWLAGRAAATASVLWARVPVRQPGCEGPPAKDELHAMYEAAYAETKAELEGGQR